MKTRCLVDIKGDKTDNEERVIDVTVTVTGVNNKVANIYMDNLRRIVEDISDLRFAYCDDNVENQVIDTLAVPYLYGDRAETIKHIRDIFKRSKLELKDTK